jgi:dihydrolipoamide dehydrogenase
MDKYKIVIIGAGSAGYVGAIRAAQMGASVCLVESAELGGVCLNWGCIPTKTILTSVKLLSRWRRSEALGISVHGQPGFDLKRIGERRDRVVRTQRNGIENLLRSHGVTLLRGKGRLVDPQTVMVNAADGEKAISAERIILATGSRPKALPHIPFDGDIVLSSDDAVELKSVPERLLIVGSGSVGAEFAFIYAGLGSRVTVLEMLDRALPLEDRDVSQVIEREMKKMGIEFVPGIKVETLLRKGNGATVILDDGAEIGVDKVLLSVGRAYNVESLSLSAAGVCIREDNSIQVNERLETTQPHVYAAGDCIGGRLLAHVASHEATAAVEHCLGTSRGIDYSTIPSCTFTMPEVASVGMTEEDALKANREIRVGRFEMRGLGKAHADDEIGGFVKIVVESSTDKILGAHIVGHEASCLIHEIVVAMRAGVPARDLGETVHAHPTLSEVVMEAAADASGSAIHKPKKQG